MIINWNKPKAGLKVISLLNKEKQISKTIRLLPGNNEIDDADWEVAKQNESIQRSMKAGYIKEVFAKAVEKDEDGNVKKDKNGQPKVKEAPAKTLNDLEAEEARAVVEDTYDIDALKKWLKAEGRDEIRAAIQNQIETIENAGAKK